MKCPPLDLLNKMSNTHPDCWDILEIMRADNGKELPVWDTLCYVPIAATISLVINGDESLMYSNPSLIDDAVALAALAPWRIYKQIYTFPIEMEELLYQQTDDCIIPFEVLKNLPYPCIYIETQKLGDHIHGFFVHFESDPNDGRLELRFLLLYDDLSIFPLAIHLIENGTIMDGIIAFSKESARVGKEKNLPFIVDMDIVAEIHKGKFNIISKMIQLVLYICARNSEVQEDPVQRKITKKPTDKKYIKDKFREIQKWNCGEETAQIIRHISSSPRYSYYNDATAPGTGTPKRPHPRRGHWHHFWTGKREGEDRKLVLNWVAPTFINKEKNDENTITRNMVENEDKD